MERAASAGRGRPRPRGSGHTHRRGRGPAYLLLLRGQLRRHVGLGRGRGLHPAAAARPTERARERREPGAAGRRFRVSVPQQPEAGSRMVGPAGPGARGGRERRSCLLKEKLSQLSLSPGGNPFFSSLLSPHSPSSPGKKKKKKGAGEELIANRDLKRKYELKNFLSPEWRVSAEISRRPPASSASGSSGA